MSEPVKLYTMTDEQEARILEASQPVPYIATGGVEPRSPQENANAAWKALGVELGFDYMTVRPEGTEPKKFYAQPREIGESG